ncbi:hypothetical protein Dsin_019177 [Dipteronia sinensis]|uniref:Uncharacterized protein n=1 Tax=Dipteronia sinensis TaxID=43782 RepID=A0AAE0A6V3_9ROSI|nr:hypothetical protein Dsin_019177 [Dipteronia sinensis]
MESALCLNYCRPPSMLLNGASTMTVERRCRATKLGSSCSSLSLSSGSPCRPLGHVISPVIRASDRPSTPPPKNDNKVIKWAVGASMVLACALGIVSCSCQMNMNPTAIAGPMEMYQKAPPVSMLSHQFGASVALKSILDVSVIMASSTEGEPSYALPKYNVPPGPSMNDVKAIKMVAVQHMKLGEGEKAVDLLRNVYEVCKDEPEPAYNVEMALVEILICQGRYKEALNCNCLKDEQRIPSDGRFPLYKAILCTMLDKEEAKKWWEEFAETIDGGWDPRNH